jgi:hypothetical protein
MLESKKWRMSTMKKLLVIAVVLAATTAAWGAELAGVSMPDSTQVADQDLVLNGMGLRKKSIVKVYVAGLYLAEKSSDAKAILDSDSARRLAMDFRYGVSAEKLCGGWDDGLENNTSNASDELKAKFATLCEYMEDVEKGDTMVYTYVPGKGTEVSVKDAVKGEIAGKDFADALWACWIGPEPPSAGFKKGLLGG